MVKSKHFQQQFEVTRFLTVEICVSQFGFLLFSRPTKDVRYTQTKNKFDEVLHIFTK